ncbi:MAG: DUF4101 domain-containing protein [Chroococcidiopsidaceae cyanobacterium CP_BM_ER_R8_30]|nr:DUF4101 domain-containing protein [Chroococcidiopsidaceae cyanobacterium CP_BM_ER_R8_30]
MRIPLDYYRILGLPVQASQEQLQQAYRDRIVQLPRQEYSDAAVAARKQLLEAAYAVLSDPNKRAYYDTSYLAHTYKSETQGFAGSTSNFPEPTQNLTEGKAGESPALLQVAFDPHTPSIEIPDEQWGSALLILQELGEYELVLQLGLPYLNGRHVSPEAGAPNTPDPVRSDIALTVALAQLELGRERWQQGRYEDAAASLEAGREMLLREGLFPNIQTEIQADLYKLRPYRILELLAQPEENVKERRQGLQLLQKLLQARGGIDGTGEDGSGLSMDDFLRFIQQLRSYLTVAEQQNLFEPYQRSSAVTAYLVAYGLMAQGFAQRLPASITRAQLLLLRLGRHQDLHLEQAVCSLLLGQTQQANSALELSQEYETLAFIREHSQDSPDLLPGLCLYGERWLQTEVFPHFRDLKQQQASLKDYFADEQVQSYLEALPPVNSLEVPPSADSNASGLLTQSSTRSLRQQTQEKAKGIQSPNPSMMSATTILSTNSDGSVIPTAARSSGATTTHRQTNIPNATTKNRQLRQSKRQRRSNQGPTANGQTLPHRWVRMSSRDLRQVLAVQRVQLLTLLAIVGVLGMVVLGFLVKQSFRATSVSLQKQSPQGLSQTSQINQPPPSPIPKPSTSPPPTTSPLTQEQAQAVIQTWLSTKAAALGPKHVDGLKQILVEPALSKWQQLVQNAKADNHYLQYNEHGLKINSINVSRTNPNRAEVEATVNEVAQVYRNGKLDRISSYDKSLHVKYHFIHQDNQWRIDDMRLLN